MKSEEYRCVMEGSNYYASIFFFDYLIVLETISTLDPDSYRVKCWFNLRRSLESSRGARAHFSNSYWLWCLNEVRKPQSSAVRRF